MGKRQVKSESALKEIRLPEEGELFGRVLKMLGGENVLIKCTDNVTRRGRIRGKLKRRVWIRDNDIVIIAPWDFNEAEKGDIVWKFENAVNIEIACNVPGHYQIGMIAKVDIK